MIATAERTTARILRWELLEGSERYERRGWVLVDTFETVPNPNVALSTWLDHQDPDQPSALYRAELPDGSRSDDIRWPDRRRRR